MKARVAPHAAVSVYPIIGARIRELRQRQRLSQRDLGARLGISHASVSYLESGYVKADIDYLTQIASALGVVFDQLLEPLWAGEG